MTTTTTNTEKMTYGKALEYVLKNCDMPTEVTDKIEALVASLAKRNATKSSKPTKTQRENAPIKAEILAYLKDCGEGKSCAEIRSAIPTLADATPQKVSALLRQLEKDEGVISRYVEKRTTYFKAV